MGQMTQSISERSETNSDATKQNKILFKQLEAPSFLQSNVPLNIKLFLSLFLSPCVYNNVADYSFPRRIEMP